MYIFILVVLLLLYYKISLNIIMLFIPAKVNWFCKLKFSIIISLIARFSILKA